MPPIAAPGPSGDLLLKVTPPRVPRELVLRSRLMAGDVRLRECPVLLLQAPAGFGKTSLLAQWRREYLGSGDVVAWLSAQQRDDPSRLIQSLALAVRMGAARPTFGHTLLDSVTTPDGLEGITAWLAEVAQSALSLVLIVDEADRLPPASREALAYLLRNAPPNLRAVVAARADCDLGFGDLIAYGQCLVLGQAALRFTLEETLSLVQARLGARADADTAARLHELAEGWPLGVQLALSAISASADPQAEVLTMTAPRGGLREHFVGLMLANLEALDLAFLTRIALLDNLHPELCRMLTGDDDASRRLERISRETPVFVAAEHGDWLRMHTLARDALRQRAEMLPLTERNGLHARASSWLAERGLLEEAAGHALLAGEHDRAYDLAERSLYESIMVRGRQGAVIAWLDRLPEAELDRRPRLLLAAAWSLALSERHEEAGRLVARILAGPEVDAALRCECALILGGAAVFADQPDRFADLHDPWAESPPLRDPLLLFVHANRTAFRTLLEGDPALARLRQQQAPRGDFGRALEYVDRWGEFIVGLSYVWEGQVLLAESLLRPTLARADADLGRRSAFSCMLAALLAAAVWELDRPADAAALLANRLDVLERNGLPETVLLAYRTLARAAMAEGAEHRALELLAGMHAVGVARGLPRLCLASLGDQVRMHARRYRADSCRRSCEQIDALMADPATPRGRLWRRHADLLSELAHGYAAIAAQDWRQAIEPLARAEALVLELGQTRLHIEILGLRAFALDRCGERSQALLREAVDLADTYGLRRVFADAHPDLGQWVLDAAPAGAGRPTPAAAPVRPDAERDGGRPRSTPSMALTPKEREVLELLARSLSNKEIGRAMQVGEETIKWHMKNLFAKLDAGTRKQVVQRARILGLLSEEG
ncbi:helix-turn-helix transcriptional regulator [Rivibacter subsaxonicus]|uniref:LuxR family transcriptional regulator n=1 Tax=Rivibacter subsaxonicus TaxID=457575 RepID=A0A4V2FUL1_9BURK|nr:LuxR C-terminal-related transcriptional regulator [Rivibacter subsaxonicus]RZU02436.1 LuxR family transcriptional regulator [Rivibacter subsaxonicus]